MFLCAYNQSVFLLTEYLGDYLNVLFVQFKKISKSSNCVVWFSRINVNGTIAKSGKNRFWR